MTFLDDLLEHASVKAILVGTFALYVFWVIAKRISEERRIQQLGGHAPYMTTYFPFCKQPLLL